jgi:hypothetical protein
MALENGGVELQSSRIENPVTPPRITEIPPNIKVNGFSSKDDALFVRRTIESAGLPIDNIPEIRFVSIRTKALASTDPETGRMSFHLDYERLPRVAQFGVIVHELAHECEPDKDKNIRLYGSKENMQRAFENAKRVAGQTTETQVFMDPAYKGSFEEMQAGKIDEERFLQETHATMIELRYTDPKHLREVLESQNKETAEEILNELDDTILMLNPHLKSREELDMHITNLHSYIERVSDQREEKRKKQPFYERALRKVISAERVTELLAGQIMMQVEIMHDMQLYPAKYGMTQEQAGGTFLTPQEPLAAKWAMDHIGDIWEISAGFTAMRIGFVALNEVLKKEPIQKLTHGYQVSDEAAFWTSLMTTWTVKAVHSMGWISLFHIHDHMANPVPGMIFGQGVAAAVLVGSHYAAKYREPIKNLAIKFGKGVIEGAKTFDKKFNEFNQRIKDLNKPQTNPSLAVDTTQEQNREEIPK